MLLAMIFFLNTIEWYLKLIAYSFIILFICLGFLFSQKNKQSFLRSIFVMNCMLFAVLAFFSICNLLGVFESLEDIEKIKQMIVSSGGFGYLIFCFVIIIQVIFLPIPAILLYLVGISLYGPFTAFVLSYISTIIGSTINFFLGKLFGKKVITWCIGEEQTIRYRKLLNTKGTALFIIMQILPFFPDDILCMIIGMSTMRFFTFFVIMVFVKPIYIGIVCFFGTGNIIPFSGWGIPVWILIFVGAIVLYILYIKNQEKMEGFLKKLFQKKKDETK